MEKHVGKSVVGKSKNVYEALAKIKHRWTSEYPEIFINPSAVMRNKIIKYIGDGEKSRRTDEELKEYFANMSEDAEIGKSPNRNWLRFNQSLVKNYIVGSKKYHSLTDKGKRVYQHLMKSANESKMAFVSFHQMEKPLILSKFDKAASIVINEMKSLISESNELDMMTIIADTENSIKKAKEEINGIPDSLIPGMISVPDIWAGGEPTVANESADGTTEKKDQHAIETKIRFDIDDHIGLLPRYISGLSNLINGNKTGGVITITFVEEVKDGRSPRFDHNGPLKLNGKSFEQSDFTMKITDVKYVGENYQDSDGSSSYINYKYDCTAQVRSIDDVTKINDARVIMSKEGTKSPRRGNI